MPFGHTLEGGRDLRASRGSARLKLDDEIVELEPWDSVRIDKDTMRNLEAGADGAELLLVGAPNSGSGDARMAQGWWAEDSRAWRAAALVDRIARNVERPAGDPLIPRRIERVRVVQVAVRSAEVLTCLELEDPGRVPRPGPSAELDRLDVAALRRDRPAARLVHPGKREDGFHRA